MLILFIWHVLLSIVFALDVHRAQTESAIRIYLRDVNCTVYRMGRFTSFDISVLQVVIFITWDVHVDITIPLISRYNFYACLYNYNT